MIFVGNMVLKDKHLVLIGSHSGCTKDFSDQKSTKITTTKKCLEIALMCFGCLPRKHLLFFI